MLSIILFIATRFNIIHFVDIAVIMEKGTKGVKHRKMHETKGKLFLNLIQMSRICYIVYLVFIYTFQVLFAHVNITSTISPIFAWLFFSPASR